jgi:hypothetical protein
MLASVNQIFTHNVRQSAGTYSVWVAIVAVVVSLVELVNTWGTTEWVGNILSSLLCSD